MSQHYQGEWWAYPQAVNTSIDSLTAAYCLSGVTALIQSQWCFEGDKQGTKVFFSSRLQVLRIVYEQLQDMK